MQNVTSMQVISLFTASLIYMIGACTPERERLLCIFPFRGCADRTSQQSSSALRPNLARRELVGPSAQLPSAGRNLMAAGREGVTTVSHEPHLAFIDVAPHGLADAPPKSYPLLPRESSAQRVIEAAGLGGQGTEATSCISSNLLSASSFGAAA